MSRLRQPRIAAVFTATAFTAAVPVLTAGSAHATEGGACESATVQYRIVDADGKTVGADWTSQGGFHSWDTMPGTVEVRLAPGQSVGDSCKYPVSLAEYTTEGPNWYTSGHQTLTDKSTVYLTAADVAGAGDEKRTWQKLGVKTPDCYGQIDLYGDDVTYDGGTGEGHGPAPYQPDNVVTPFHLIAAWNGGEKPCAPTQPSSPAAPPSESTPATPSTPTTPASSEPPAGQSKPPTSPGTSTTPPTDSDVPPQESTPPTTPTPSPSESTPPLAETGASAPVGLIAGAAAVVVAAGAGTLYAAGRRRRS